MRRIRVAHIALVLISMAVVFAIAFTPQISQAKKLSWDFNFGLGAAYDNNILKYSDADLDQFDATAADSTGKFGIESKDDFIFSPRLEIGVKSRLFKHTFRAGIGGGYYIYAKNDEKNYASFKIWLRQYVRKGVYIQLTSTYVPDYYYRNLYATGFGFRKAEFDKLSLEMMLFAPVYKNVEGSFSYSFDNKNFNPDFDERDLKAHNFGLELSFRPKQLYKIWGGYDYTIARSAGRDNLNDRRDTSFDSFLFSLGSRFYVTGFKNREAHLGVSISYKDILFQTDKLSAEDRYRFARQDNRWSVTLNAYQDIGKKYSVGFIFNRLINKTDLPADYLKPYLDFSSTSAKIIFDYSF